MNQTVTATNMQIKAAVPTQLLIKGSASGAAYKSAIDFTAAADSEKYQSNAALTNVPAVSYKLQGTTGTYALITDTDSWLKLTDAASAYVSDTGRMIGLADGENYDTWAERVTDAELASPVYYTHAAANDYSGGATGDYIKDTFTLKLNGEVADATDTVAVTIGITTTDTDFLDADEDGVEDEGTDKFLTNIYKAVHIAFTWGTNGYKEFDLGSVAPVYGTSAAAATLTLGSATTWLNTFDHNEEEVEFTLYIWYDGEDADCMNSNAARIDQLKFNFTFTLGAGA